MSKMVGFLFFLWFSLFKSPYLMHTPALLRPLNGCISFQRKQIKIWQEHNSSQHTHTCPSLSTPPLLVNTTHHRETPLRVCHPRVRIARCHPHWSNPTITHTHTHPSITPQHRCCYVHLLLKHVDNSNKMHCVARLVGQRSHACTEESPGHSLN